MMAFCGSMPAATAALAAATAASSSPSMTACFSLTQDRGFVCHRQPRYEQSLRPTLVRGHRASSVIVSSDRTHDSGRDHLSHVHRRGLGRHLAAGHEGVSARMVLALVDATSCRRPHLVGRALLDRDGVHIPHDDAIGEHLARLWRAPLPCPR